MGYNELWEHFYRKANDMFDEKVFDPNEGLIDEYNDRDDDDARDALFDIVNEMTAVGMSRGTKAMKTVLERRAHEFYEAMAETEDQER